MATKLYDIAAKTGEYIDQTGKPKARWQTVGAVMQGQDGGQFIMLAAWFNPAGVPRKEGGESVLLSCFEPQQREQAPQQPQQPQRQQGPQGRGQAPQRQAPVRHQGSGFDDMADDVPY